jgi:hypothetical protein
LDKALLRGVADSILRHLPNNADLILRSAFFTRVSKDGCESVRPRPSFETPRQEARLLRMRAAMIHKRSG